MYTITQQKHTTAAIEKYRSAKNEVCLKAILSYSNRHDEAELGTQSNLHAPNSNPRGESEKTAFVATLSALASVPEMAVPATMAYRSSSTSATKGRPFVFGRELSWADVANLGVLRRQLVELAKECTLSNAIKYASGYNREQDQSKAGPPSSRSLHLRGSRLSISSK